jgi:hypothetical protein
MGMSRLLGTGVQPKFNPSGRHDNRPAPWFRLVDMDMDLREAFDQGFGPEPVHPPVSERVEAGHRAMRRRHVAGAVVTVATAAVVGLGAVAVLGGGDSPSQLAADPTSGPTAEAAADWAEDELARFDSDGNLEVRPGVTVLERIDSPFPPSAGMDRSVGLALEGGGDVTWMLMTWNTDDDGYTSESGVAWAPGEAGSFTEWVTEQVRLQTTPTPEDNSAGYVEFAGDGSLVSSHGVQVLDQRHPVRLKNFTLGDEPTAAALLQGPDGKKWYVLVRDIDDVDVIAVPFKTGGPTLDDFLAYARTKYDEGVGLR